MSDPIDLARAAPFALGALEVRPATREVVAGASSEVLQPRIMQVLVALATRGGEVVSRDELIRMCWDGQVVGDDAINRCIAKLRQLGESHGAFEIVTIARVGYRLTAAADEVVLAAKADATPVLAVLPFENLSSDPEMQFFSDGVSEEILNAVARVGGLRLIGSTSSFSFRGARKSEAAAALKATHVLDGSVQRAGARVRVNVQLTEAGRGEIVWSERYDREIADVFALQDEIATMAAQTLSARLAPPPPRPKIDPRAVDLYLRAISVRKAYDSEQQERAISHLEAALAIEPNFARARAALALTLCHRILAATVISAPAEAFDEAVAAVEAEARRALALDPTEPQAQIAALSVQTTINAWSAHEAAIDAALLAAANDPLLLTLKARFVTSVGRLRAGFDVNQWVVDNDPFSARAIAFQAVRSTSMNADYATAREGVDRAYAMAPKDPLVWRLRTAVLAYQHDWAESLKMNEIGLDVGQTPERLAFIKMGMEYELAGGGREGHPIISTARVLSKRSPFLFTALVFTMIATHDFYDEAFDFIDDAMQAHPPQRLWSQWNTESLSVTPTLVFFVYSAAGFRADPRFLPLCAKLGLCAYWSETGRWPDFIVDAPNRGELEAKVRELAAG